MMTLSVTFHSDERHCADSRFSSSDIFSLVTRQAASAHSSDWLFQVLQGKEDAQVLLECKQSLLAESWTDDISSPSS